MPRKQMTKFHKKLQLRLNIMMKIQTRWQTADQDET